MLLPRLVEAHCHLDKCHALPLLGAVGGDLSAAIAAQSALGGTRDAGHLAGCGLVRSHVDWGDEPDPPRAWNILTGLELDEIQWAALTGIDRMADAATARSVARHVARAGGVLGSFVLDRRPDEIRTGLARLFADASRLGLMLDFHVDEGLGQHTGWRRLPTWRWRPGSRGRSSAATP